MNAANEPNGVDASGLRERLPNKPEAPQKALSVETAQEAVRALNEQEQAEGKDEKDRKTYGRTLDGTGEYSQQCSPRHGVERTSFCRSDTLGRSRKPIESFVVARGSLTRPCSSQPAALI